MSEVAERRRARALQSLVFVIVPVGIVVSTTQLFTLPNFLPTFLSNMVAIALVSIAGALSRTRFHRLGAVGAMLVVLGAVAFAGLARADDPVWWVFSMIPVILATLLLSSRGATLISVGALLVVLAVEIARGFDSQTSLPHLLCLALLIPSLLVVSRYRDRLDASRWPRSSTRGLVDGRR